MGTHSILHVVAGLTVVGALLSLPTPGIFHSLHE